MQNSVVRFNIKQKKLWNNYISLKKIFFPQTDFQLYVEYIDF